MTQKPNSGDPLDWHTKANAFANAPGSIEEAIEAGDLAKVARLLDEDYQLLHYRDPNILWQPLHTAAAVNQAGIIELLIRYGAEIDSRDYQGMTPLHRAAQNACVEAIEVLVRHG